MEFSDAFKTTLMETAKTLHGSPGVKTGPTTDEMKEVLRAFLRDELPAAIAPIVLKAVRARTDHAHQAELVRLLTGAVERLADLAVTGREQNELARQTVQLINLHQETATPHRLSLMTRRQRTSSDRPALLSYRPAPDYAQTYWRNAPLDYDRAAMSGWYAHHEPRRS